MEPQHLDRVRVVTADGATFEGVLMPRHSFSDEGILVLKLDNGYNVGLNEDGAKVTFLERPEEAEMLTREVAEDPAKPTIAILGTGGTIASFVDYRTGGVQPATTPSELAAAAPGLADFCNIRAEVVFQMFSEDMQPEHWVTLAERAAWHLNNGCSGVVIGHGTDTMSYTSAALSFCLQTITGPVILVGSQRSSDRPSSDATMNLEAAALVAATQPVREVLVAMHDSSEDTRVALHRGTRVRKNHTSRRDAFQSVNTLPLGYVEDGKVHWNEPPRPLVEGPCEAVAKFDEEVSMITAYPGLWPDHIEDVVRKATVLVGTGLGHVARRCLPAIEKVIERGAHVVMTSQCIHGRTNLNVYSTGRDLKQLGVIEAQDMLPEVAYVKMMWLLGTESDPTRIRELFQTDLAGELGEETHPLAFGHNRDPTELDLTEVDA